VLGWTEARKVHGQIGAKAYTPSSQLVSSIEGAEGRCSRPPRTRTPLNARVEWSGSRGARPGDVGQTRWQWRNAKTL
jgi:hypothetical protein